MLYILIGVGAGVLAGLFGIGGGVVIVPALLYFARMSPLKATGTSLGALLLPVGALGCVGVLPKREPRPARGARDRGRIVFRRVFRRAARSGADGRTAQAGVRGVSGDDRDTGLDEQIAQLLLAARCNCVVAQRFTQPLLAARCCHSPNETRSTVDVRQRTGTPTPTAQTRRLGCRTASG